MATATFGGGCFWCTEAVFKSLKGVQRVVSGYAGGHVVNPTYEQVCGKQTGHAEVVQITFDPDIISYADLVRIHLTTHDPTTPNRQGADVGPQYRSAIFYHDQEQKTAAQAVVAEITSEEVYDDPIVTEIEQMDTFYPAESYHQDYFERNPAQPYCAAVIAPKVAKFRKTYRERLAA
jgi:peptide-methionine (S)-S-oxide reductase